MDRVYGGLEKGVINLNLVVLDMGMARSFTWLW